MQRQPNSYTVNGDVVTLKLERVNGDTYHVCFDLADYELIRSKHWRINTGYGRPQAQTGTVSMGRYLLSCQAHEQVRYRDFDSLNCCRANLFAKATAGRYEVRTRQYTVDADPNAVACKPQPPEATPEVDDLDALTEQVLAILLPAAERGEDMVTRFFGTRRAGRSRA